MGRAESMTVQSARDRILARLRDKIHRRLPVIGAGAGTGLSAKCEEEGGVDLIVLYNSGRYRMAGRGSLAGMLAYGNANEIVVEMAREILTVVTHTPVLAGVNGTDPFMLRTRFLHELKDLGFVGVQNFPTVGLIDGTFREHLEETGMGYQCEVELIREAHEHDMLTTPYVFDPEQAIRMTEAGADIVVAHLGLTTSGAIGAGKSLSLEESTGAVQAIVDAAKSIRSEVIVLCHGGPIATPEDAEHLFQLVRGIDGFYGASSLERLPVEEAITERTRRFTQLRL
jgi:predicted TIM-barrel enzyme